jgi:hypothetical protein
MLLYKQNHMSGVEGHITDSKPGASDARVVNKPDINLSRIYIPTNVVGLSNLSQLRWLSSGL